MKRQPVPERFMAKAVKTAGGCWLWRAARDPGKYGHFNIPDVGIIGAHRASWLLFRGPIPEGIFVCHSCDVKNCVNPEHLFLGTGVDNMQDCSRKGRINRTIKARGAENPKARFSEPEVVAIRGAHGAGERICDIARRLGCSRSAIAHIVKRRSWAVGDAANDLRELDVEIRMTR